MLFIVRGLPGSGKSTFSHFRFPGVFHVENDMYHMNDKGIYKFDNDKQQLAALFCHNAVRLAIENKIPVVVSNVFVTKNSLYSYIAIAEVNNIKYKVYRCISQFKNQHNVPDDVFQSMKNKFEDYPGEELIDVSKFPIHILKKDNL